MDQIFWALKTCADKNKLLFVKIVKQSLNKILGNAASETLIYCLGGDEALGDPNLMACRLKDMLGTGVDVILKYMLKEIEKPDSALKFSGYLRDFSLC